jgi:predicted ATP-grasp superfamily ATP-dependent carboligase
MLGTSLTALAVARVAVRAGYEVVMLDDRRGPATETRLARFRFMESADPAVVCAHVKDEARAAGTVLLADSDRWLRFVAPNFAALEACGVTVLHPQPAQIGTCLDKTAFLRWCEREHLPAPRLHEPGTGSAARLQYPLMIRPEASLHAVATALPKAREIPDAASLEQWLSEFAAAGVKATVCESLVSPRVRQFSVGAARNRRGEVRIFLAEKVRPLADRCAGGTFVRPVGENPKVADLARQTLDRLDYFGVAEVEILHDESTGRIGLIEVNARPWLQFTLPYACGEDLLAHALERPASRRPGSKRHAWLSFHADLLQCFSRSTGMYKHGEIRFAEYVRTLWAADVYLLWDPKDPGPFMRSVGRLCARAWRRLWRRRRADAPAPALRSGARES